MIELLRKQKADIFSEKADLTQELYNKTIKMETAEKRHEREMEDRQVDFKRWHENHEWEMDKLKKETREEARTW